MKFKKKSYVVITNLIDWILIKNFFIRNGYIEVLNSKFSFPILGCAGFNKDLEKFGISTRNPTSIKDLCKNIDEFIEISTGYPIKLSKSHNSIIFKY